MKQWYTLYVFLYSYQDIINSTSSHCVFSEYQALHLVIEISSYTTQSKSGMDYQTNPNNTVGVIAYPYADSLVEDCSNSKVLVIELLQSCTKPSILKSHWNYN